jgi:hypothetical protein
MLGAAMDVINSIQHVPHAIPKLAQDLAACSQYKIFPLHLPIAEREYFLGFEGTLFVCLGILATLLAAPLHKLARYFVWLVLIVGFICGPFSIYVVWERACESWMVVAEVDAEVLLYFALLLFAGWAVLRAAATIGRRRKMRRRQEVARKLELKKRIDPQKTVFRAKLAEGGLVGRQWVFAEIERWRTKSHETCMAIVGGTGIGKSAIAAELVKRGDERLLAYYVCSRSESDTLNPKNFVQALAAMVRERMSDYAEFPSEFTARPLKMPKLFFAMKFLVL